ncbi:hypothetical protein [Nocardia sp. NPDC006630]|uniref:hypothetical protein n=1 Tax=Nocardia sp. NPDC006630 TaxID=3157181 RepID=UPI0033AE85A2
MVHNNFGQPDNERRSFKRTVLLSLMSLLTGGSLVMSVSIHNEATFVAEVPLQTAPGNPDVNHPMGECLARQYELPNGR